MRSIFALCAAALCAAATPAQPKPAFIYESLLDGYFDNESGLISFTEYDLAFAPETLNAKIAITNAEGTVVESFDFFDEYRYREGVFAKAQVKGPADVTLTEPGVYNIVFLVDGEMATRLPVVLEQTGEGDDPFNPVKTYRFYGLWQVYAHLSTQTFSDEPYLLPTFWVGGRDLAEGTTKDNFKATLKRDGEIIGHSKRTQGFISDGHYNRVDIQIYKPHEDRATANAELLMLPDWTADGSYELLITRKHDNALIRRFVFTAEGGEIAQLPATELGFEPRIDYIVPRIPDRNTQLYDFEEATWIKSEPAAQDAPATPADESSESP